jgi:hypothetical protein
MHIAAEIFRGRLEEPLRGAMSVPLRSMLAKLCTVFEASRRAIINGNTERLFQNIKLRGLPRSSRFENVPGNETECSKHPHRCAHVVKA